MKKTSNQLVVDYSDESPNFAEFIIASKNELGSVTLDGSPVGYFLLLIYGGKKQDQ